MSFSSVEDDPDDDESEDVAESDPATDCDSKPAECFFFKRLARFFAFFSDIQELVAWP